MQNRKGFRSEFLNDRVQRIEVGHFPVYFGDRYLGVFLINPFSIIV